MTRLEPKDRNGTTIVSGMLVRVIGMPDLDGMAAPEQAATSAVFRSLLGKYKPVKDFDEHGLVELSFQLPDGDGRRRLHTVWIEPFLLQVPLRRR